MKKMLDGMSYYEIKTHSNLVNILMGRSQGFHAILTGFPWLNLWGFQGKMFDLFMNFHGLKTDFSDPLISLRDW